MKKRVLIVVLLILLVVSLMVAITNRKVYTEIDGIKYAILVDGVSSNSFPSGNYKVDVECTNADGYWDNIKQKIIVKRIKGNVTCSVEFNSITNDDYLDEYIMNLENESIVESGTLIHEMGATLISTNTSVITTYGITPVYFRGRNYTTASPVDFDDFWTFSTSTGIFTSNPSLFYGTNYYSVYTKVPSDGYYQICYTIAQGYVSNVLEIIKNGVTIKKIKPINETLEGCYNMGYFQTTDELIVLENGYNDTSSPVMSFKLEKDNNPSLIDTGYRYEGPDPNNYIMFNNELWRIIGVFETEYDSNNNGIANATGNLVKIIRMESIGGIDWDISRNNEWPNSSLYHLLNEQYYDWETNKANVSTYCYGYQSTIPAKCNYSVNGIQDEYRDMIVKAKWYLGGSGKYGYDNYTPGFIYTYERDANTTYNNHSSSTLGYIGLMYESDYLYGALLKDCHRTITHDSYNLCNKNWIYIGEECTISPTTNSTTHVWCIENRKNVDYMNANYAKNVRPTLYLSPDVYRVSGTGTMTDPYIIGMADTRSPS